MKIKYITIEREYGSGGTEIAKKLAAKCSINCYGEEILEDASKQLQISVAEAQEYEEKVTNSFLYSLYVMSQAQNGNVDVLPMETKLYMAEHNAIVALAQKGRCVFVGHCASEALKDKSSVLRVFIRAEDAFKRGRMVTDYGVAEKDADTVCRKFNRKRANYYAFNTSKKWDDLTNYDIVLDSSRIGIEGCVNVLAAMLNMKAVGKGSEDYE